MRNGHPKGAESGALGHLESQVMDVLWSKADCTVRDVADTLSRPLAYTTVMTTLDRLFKKGLLERRKAERAFVYNATLSREQWRRKRAESLLVTLLHPSQMREFLMSCLLGSAGEHDHRALDELERLIRQKRTELNEAK